MALVQWSGQNNHVNVVGWHPITNEVSQLDSYFKERIIGGPGAFVMKALDYQEFATVFSRELIREVIGDNVFSIKPD